MNQDLDVFIKFKETQNIILFLKQKNQIEKDDFFDILMYSIQFNDKAVLNTIMELFIAGRCPVNINERSSNGLTPLALTILYDNFDFFQKLILMGASPITRLYRNILKMDMDLRNKSARCVTRRMTPLSIAVDLGRLDMIKYIRGGIDKNICLEEALRIIDKKENQEMLSLLLEECSDLIKMRLFNAVERNNVDVFLSLLKTGKLETLNILNQDGYTPLIVAVKNKAYDVFDVLITTYKEKKIHFDIDYVCNHTTALNEAIESNEMFLTKRLLFVGANPLADLGENEVNNQGERIIKTPFFNGAKKALRYKENKPLFFLVGAVFPNTEYVAEIVKISRFWGLDKECELLLENKMDLSENNAFHIRMIKAVKENDVDFVRFLVQRKISPFYKANGETALSVAVKEGRLEILKEFIDVVGIRKINEQQDVSLFEHALWYGQEDVCNYLLKKGFFIPETFKMGESVLKRIIDFDMGSLLKEYSLKKKLNKDLLQKILCKSIVMWRNKCVKAICDLKLNVNFKRKSGLTPFLMAVKRKNIQAALTLLEAGADNKSVDGQGMSALHIAVLSGNIRFTSFLLKRGFDPNIKNKMGQTPLMLAAENGYSKISAILVYFGADACVLDNLGKRPIDYYKKYKLKNQNRRERM